MPAKVFAAILLAVSASTQAAASSPYIVVVEKVGGAVGFYGEDGASLGQVKVGDFPHEAVLSRDGRYLYVSDNGVLWMTEDKLGTNRISIVDVRAMKKIGDIDLGRFHRPHGMALVPGSDHLLATTQRPFGLILVDPTARRVLKNFDVKGKSPHMVIPQPDGKWAFVSDTDSDVLAAVELATGRVNTIPMPKYPQGAVLSPDGSRLYVACRDGNQIAIVDTASQRTIGSIATGKGPARVAVTPDGKTLVYNLQFQPAVGFADVQSGKQIATIPLPGRPLSLTMTRDGRRAFTGVQDLDKVYFISVPARKIERVIDTPKGSGPDPAIPLE